MDYLKLRVNVMLKEKIKMLAKERGISITKMCNELLEIGVLKIIENELKVLDIKI